ncbi:PTS sugar transporter subunit IIA [Bacillus sp. SD075]|uniref:PTS sugar transporter subunit IIA n=1 Tax=Bacillus sp. SD075 TaxID=2781732 RepID=UPI001A95F762|nr:PTS sugar transporter subunit IIA [Bacillus sp. SD075]MBO0998793.1 PTS sugar transporter subunit IIA [Bacillus sp. SD075]
MPLEQFVKDDLIKLHIKCENQDQLFDVMYQEAFKLGYVSDSFLGKIKEREASFPTGLNLDHYNVAIPHTDPECVFEQFIGVVTLEKPIRFRLMDDNTKEVDVYVILMLGLNQPHSQLKVLQQLMQVIQDERNYQQISKAQTNEEIRSVFKKINLNAKGE